MSLADGDPAPDGHIWFRVVTNESHIKRGRVGVLILEEVRGGMSEGAWNEES
jgi:hypothetical protein